MRGIHDIDAICREFRGYLALQRGFSPHTLDAYLRDVNKLLAYLSDEGVALRDTDYGILQNFAAAIYDLGIAAASRKRVLCGIKTFFKFLKSAGYTDNDPSMLLETPRLGRALPDVLSVEEIDMIINAIDPATAEAERNRAIIETLYGCGLRVSELVDLEITRVALDDEYIIVRGKGNKERMVPMSPVAAGCIRNYIEGSRGDIVVKPEAANILFLNRRGNRLTRQMVFIMLRRLAEAADIHKKISRTPCATPSPPTCSKVVPTCAQSSRCSAMKASRPPKSTCTPTTPACARKSYSITQGIWAGGEVEKFRS